MPNNRAVVVPIYRFSFSWLIKGSQRKQLERLFNSLDEIVYCESVILSLRFLFIVNMGGGSIPLLSGNRKSLA